MILLHALEFLPIYCSCLRPLLARCRRLLHRIIPAAFWGVPAVSAISE